MTNSFFWFKITSFLLELNPLIWGISVFIIGFIISIAIYKKYKESKTFNLVLKYFTISGYLITFYYSWKFFNDASDGFLSRLHNPNLVSYFELLDSFIYIALIMVCLAAVFRLRLDNLLCLWLKSKELEYRVEKGKIEANLNKQELDR